MKKKKIIITGIILSLIMVSTISVYAATNFQTKAEILSDLTGKNVEEIVEQIQNENKTFCEIANDNGVLDEFSEYTRSNSHQCDGTGIGKSNKEEIRQQNHYMMNLKECKNLNCTKNECIYK